MFNGCNEARPELVLLKVSKKFLIVFNKRRKRYLKFEHVFAIANFYFSDSLILMILKNDKAWII